MRQTKLAYVDVDAKPPREVQRQQLKYRTDVVAVWASARYHKLRKRKQTTATTSSGILSTSTPESTVAQLKPKQKNTETLKENVTVNTNRCGTTMSLKNHIEE